MSKHFKSVLIGIIFIFSGILIILYVGFILLLAGGILTVAEQLSLSSTESSIYALGWGFIKIGLFPALVYTVCTLLFKTGFQRLTKEDMNEIYIE